MTCKWLLFSDASVPRAVPRKNILGSVRPQMEKSHVLHRFIVDNLVLPLSQACTSIHISIHTRRDISNPVFVRRHFVGGKREKKISRETLKEASSGVTKHIRYQLSDFLSDDVESAHHELHGRPSGSLVLFRGALRLVPLAIQREAHLT